jgi:hypothetical protein
MIQADTGRVLLPLLPMAFHPGIIRLAEWARAARAESGSTDALLLELEIASTEEVLLEAGIEGHKPGFPAWEVLRFLGGEINEVFALSTQAELQPGQSCLLSGRFVKGGLFQATYLPNRSETRFRLAWVTPTGRMTLTFPQGWPGPSQLTFVDDQGEDRTETWEAFHPWAMMLDHFEQIVLRAAVKAPQPGQPAAECLTKAPACLGWQDELRALELDDAARRSVERGRSSTLEFQEATEEASFKGTMTLVGCSLIWLSVLVLILSVWVPWFGWVIAPIFGVFLIMQALRWIVPKQGT